MRIAMWSGPRNLSTAMMYSFANRADMSVVDEPFYASYLKLTGLDHPMREAVLQSQSTNPDVVARNLLAAVSTPHQYQKHMTQHMVPGIPRDWMSDVRNLFLVRHSARVLASWNNKHDALTLSDIGFVQQLELFDALAAVGQTPIVLDAADIRENPEGMLKALCAAIELEWDAGMLAWQAGPKPFDGIWAAHWYDAVHRSTGFAGSEGPLPDLRGDLAKLNERALPLYERMAALKLSC